MIHVSSEFREQMEVRTDFKEQAEVTFLDGTKLSLTEDDFTVSNNSITDGAGSNGLPLGAAIQRQVQIELMNDDDHLEKYDFVGAQIRLYMTFWLPKTKELKERIEKIECGYFTVTKPETYGQTVIVAAVDDMYRADKAFYSDLIFPVSASELFIEMCEHCGIQPGNTLFRNNDFTIKEKPSGSDLTFRAVFGYLAMLAAGNARISRQGTLEILSYDFSVLDQEGVHIQELRNFNSLKIGTEDVVITGIRMKVKGKTAEEDQTFLCGKEGYLIEVENPLVAGQEQQLVDSIGQRLIGVHLRDFSGDHIAYPLAEFMDLVYVEDRKGRKYQSILTDIDFTFLGITTFKNSAISAIRNSSKFSSGASKTYEETRDLITKEREARDTAIENLARKLESSSGLYCTKDEQPDGSTIYYMHDKAKLSESMIIWKMTAEAIGISTDGGKTYPTGIDATGMAILNKIYAIGIDAKYVNTGTLDADLVKVINLHLQDISDGKGVTLDATLNGITADVSSKYTELDGKISENFASISMLPDSITSTVKKSYIDPLTGRVIEAENDIESAENRITQNEKDILAARSEITQTASSITANVSALYQELDGKISNNSSSISMLPDSITSTVKTTYIDPLTGRVSNAESDIDAAEKRITQNEKDILSAQASITQTASSITADVSAKYKELDGKISDNSASISLLPNSITSTVKTTYIDPLTTRMESAEASIKINEQGIESKVSKNSVISSINQSSESVTISASKINLKGAVTISSLDSDLKTSVNNANTASSTLSSWSYDNNMTTIDGGKVAAQTITAGHIAIGDFTNYATVTENDSATLLSDQAISSSSTHGDWIEKKDKQTGLKHLFVSQLYCINSFVKDDVLKFDFNVWCEAAQTVTYGIWLYDGSKTFKTGAWNTAEVPEKGAFRNFTGTVKVPTLPINTKYYRVGFEFKKYDSTSRNCVQKVKVTKISGYLQIGEGFIDSAGPFKIGCMQSVGELNDDVEFKHAIFIDYGIELLAGNDGSTPYIDFHTEATSHDNAAYDYTARLQNTQKSWITFYGLSDGKNPPAGCTVQSAQFRGTLVNDSDRRLKQDIVDLSIDEVLKEISKYRPVSYKYINGVDDNVHHGLIAQEAQEIAQWGLVDDRGEYLAINYIDLISDLIKTTQYSLKEIEKLKTIIDN
jgi:hypothetical protein|nr:MAG TPA: endosialidase chaperone [Caudoviricetes sp.]